MLETKLYPGVCSRIMPVSVKVYYGKDPKDTTTVEIRRFIFRPDDPRGKQGIYRNLVERIRALFNGLNLHEFNLCWKDEDGDYVVFSSDDELKVALNSATDNTLKIYIREKEVPCRPIPTTSGMQQQSQTAVHVNRRVDIFRTSRMDRDLTPNYRGYPLADFDEFDPGMPIAANAGVHNNVSPTHPSMDNAGDRVDVMLCSECHGEGRGVWYKCTVCPRYHLCSECENRGLHDQHIMMRAKPASNPLSPNAQTSLRDHR